MDRPIRIALVGLAPMIRDVVTNVIAGQADMQITSVVDSGGAVADAIRGESVDVLLLGVQSTAPEAECETLLGAAALPQRVVGISADGRKMMVSELRPATAALGALSPGQLLELMRRGRVRIRTVDIADGWVQGDTHDFNEGT